MQYIEQKEIFEKTDGGRWVIETYFPNSVQSFTDTRRKFKLRDTEKTPSAALKQLPDGVWVVTDFGNDQKPRNCIQLVMHEEHCTFIEAINIIAVKFNILPEEKKAEIYRPGYNKRDATPDELDGKWYFETKDFTMTEVLTIIAPEVWKYLLRLVPKDKTDEAERMEAAMEEIVRIFRLYHFHSLAKYTIVKNRQATELTSTDSYPIFMFDEKDFKKIYQPKNLEAGKRFLHYNGRPSDFIFGYEQAHKAYNEIVKINDTEDEMLDEDKPKDTKKPKKLKQLIIATGGSDALNLACIGQCFKSKKPEHLAEQYFPVWLNSETAKLTAGQFKNIQSISEIVYNIPDLDSTGRKAAHQLALEYLDIHTLYLPDELLTRKDAFRNKPCKDLRDYFRYYSPWDFFKLFKIAYPYRFWDIQPRYNKKAEFVGMGYNVNNKYMLNFLHRNGFYRYAAESEKDMYFYIHIQDNIVKRVEPKRIRDYINEFIEKRYPEVELMNTFLRTTQLNENSLSNLPFIELDFTDFEKDAQWMFFKNRTVRVSDAGIYDYRLGEADRYVWDDEVIQHKISDPTQKPGILPPFFTITGPGLPPADGATPATDWNIEFHNTNCLVMRYLINGSRIYWREELERRMEGIPEKDRENYALAFNLSKEQLKLMDGLNKEQQAEYKVNYKFSLNGPLLLLSEIYEHKLHFINKCYTIGYVFHRYKNPSKPWAVWTMDAKLSDGNESHGGSGKSLLPDRLIREHKLMKTEYREGRNKKLTDNPHIYENITKHTDLVLVDDCHQYIPFEFFFSAVTGPTQVNPKNNKQYTVPYGLSPKWWFTSNYSPRDIDPSKARRLLYNIFSDYYHESQGGEYRESRSVRDDFGKNLGDDFTEEEWNYFLNFILQCIHFYLSCSVKVNPPMDNINKRNLKSIMGDGFETWADVYFSRESGRLNNLEDKSEALNDFVKNTKQNWTTQKFTKAIHAWCNFNGFELDPDEFQNSQKRIIRKVKEKRADGTEKEVTKEMIYIRTTTPTTTDPDTQSCKDDDDDLPF